MKTIFHTFWRWYEKNLTFYTGFAAFLFAWQLIHLFWLFMNVVLLRLGGVSYFDISGVGEYAIIVVDYIEIPSLILVSLIYINELRKRFHWRPIWFLIFLNSQWLHLLWITDEFVVRQLIEPSYMPLLPVWLVWIAIGIDYLELPVIYDTSKRFMTIIKNKFSES